MEGGLMSFKTAVRALVLALLVVGFIAWQTARDHQADQREDDCRLTAALSELPDDDC